MSQDSGSESGTDLLSLWRRALALQEEQWSRLFERTTSTDAFARALASSLEKFLDAAQVSRERIDRTLEVADVPSRADVAALSRRIDALTDAVDALGEAMRKGNAPKSKPKRKMVPKARPRSRKQRSAKDKTH